MLAVNEVNKKEKKIQGKLHKMIVQKIDDPVMNFFLNTFCGKSVN